MHHCIYSLPLTYNAFNTLSKTIRQVLVLHHLKSRHQHECHTGFDNLALSTVHRFSASMLQLHAFERVEWVNLCNLSNFNCFSLVRLVKQHIECMCWTTVSKLCFTSESINLAAFGYQQSNDWTCIKGYGACQIVATNNNVNNWTQQTQHLLDQHVCRN